MGPPQVHRTKLQIEEVVEYRLEVDDRPRHAQELRYALSIERLISLAMSILHSRRSQTLYYDDFDDQNKQILQACVASIALPTVRDSWMMQPTCSRGRQRCKLISDMIVEILIVIRGRCFCQTETEMVPPLTSIQLNDFRLMRASHSTRVTYRMQVPSSEAQRRT